MKLLAVFSLTLLFSLALEARIYNEKDFSSINQYQRYTRLIGELRCLVCQNQSLASSDASLAANLRSIVFEQLEAGKSDDDIRHFMVERYGNFVLYDPPFISDTFVLWLGPLALLLIGLLFVIFFIRKQTKTAGFD